MVNGSLPAREVWIEISSDDVRFYRTVPSLPAREVWIEIMSVSWVWNGVRVTSRKGSVD